MKLLKRTVIMKIKGDSGTEYEIYTKEDDPNYPRCSCPAYIYSGRARTCKHIKRNKDELREMGYFKPQGEQNVSEHKGEDGLSAISSSS